MVEPTAGRGMTFSDLPAPASRDQPKEDSPASIFQSRNEPEIEIYFQYKMSLKSTFVSNAA